jgi:hypothetical protein
LAAEFPLGWQQLDLDVQRDVQNIWRILSVLNDDLLLLLLLAIPFCPQIGGQ